MVFGDLGDSKPQSFPVRAPVQERFIAFCFDVLLIVPCLSFTSLLVLKFIQGLSETEHFVAFGFFAVVQWVWVNAFFVATSGATPGKAILKLKIVSTVHPDAVPSWDQALLRSLLWMFEMCYLGIPMLRVFREEWRRPFHDRWASTVVVTLKDPDAVVTEHEKSLAKYLLYGANGFFAVWFATLFLFVAPKVRPELERVPAAERESADAGGCAAMTNVSSARHPRVEQAILLHEEKVIDTECLEEEIEFAMDTGDAAARAWASLATAYVHREDRKFSSDYLAEACALVPGDTGPCRNAHAFYNESPAQGESLLEQWSAWRLDTSKNAAFLAEFPFIGEKRAMEKMTDADEIDAAAEFYEARREEWPKPLQRSMTSMLCLAELTHECSDRQISACELVSGTVKRESAIAWDPAETTGWIEYQRCQNEPRGSLDEWRSLAEKRPDLYLYAKLLLGDREKGVSQAQTARFIEDSAIPREIRSRALVHLTHEIARRGNESGINLIASIRAIDDSSVLGRLAARRALATTDGSPVLAIGPALRPMHIRPKASTPTALDTRAPASAQGTEDEK